MYKTRSLIPAIVAILLPALTLALAACSNDAKAPAEQTPSIVDPQNGTSVANYFPGIEYSMSGLRAGVTSFFEEVKRYFPPFDYHVNGTSRDTPSFHVEVSSDETFATVFESTSVFPPSGRVKLNKALTEGTWFARITASDVSSGTSKAVWSPVISFTIVTPELLPWLKGGEVAVLQEDGALAGTKNLPGAGSTEIPSWDQTPPEFPLTRTPGGTWLAAFRYNDPDSDEAPDNRDTGTKIVALGKDLKPGTTYTIPNVFVRSLAASADGKTAIAGSLGPYDDATETKLLSVVDTQGHEVYFKTGDELVALLYDGVSMPAPALPKDVSKIKPGFSHRVESLSFGAGGSLVLVGTTDLDYRLVSGNTDKGGQFGTIGWALCLDATGKVLWKTLLSDGANKGSSTQALASLDTDAGILVVGSLGMPFSLESQGTGEFKIWYLDKTTGRIARQSKSSRSSADVTIPSWSAGSHLIQFVDDYLVSLGDQLIRFNRDGNIVQAVRFFSKSQSQTSYLGDPDGYKMTDMFISGLFQISQGRCFATIDVFQGDFVVQHSALAILDDLDTISWHQYQASGGPAASEEEAAEVFQYEFILADISKTEDEVNQVKTGEDISRDDVIGYWVDPETYDTRDSLSYYFHDDGSYEKTEGDEDISGTWSFEPESGELVLRYRYSEEEDSAPESETLTVDRVSPNFITIDSYTFVTGYR